MLLRTGFGWGGSYHGDGHHGGIGDVHGAVHVTAVLGLEHDVELCDIEALELVQACIPISIDRALSQSKSTQSEKLTLHSNSLVIRNRSLRQRTLPQPGPTINIHLNLLIQHNSLRKVAKSTSIAQINNLIDINLCAILGLNFRHLHGGECLRGAEKRH